jgi:hypothetical protein
LLIFELQDERGQAEIAALREKDEEDQREKFTTIILARLLKNSEIVLPIRALEAMASY